MSDIISRIEQNPVIAAIRKEEDADAAVCSAVSTIFLLHADIFNIKRLVEKIKTHQKNVFVHIDLLEGIGRDNKAIDYIAEVIEPDGVLTTRSTQIKYARERGLFAIQRFFLIDSLSFNTTIKTVKSTRPDMIEIMPAVMPGVIKKICSRVHIPVIAGGLIDTREDVIEILKSGAIGISTGKKELWNL